MARRMTRNEIAVAAGVLVFLALIALVASMLRRNPIALDWRASRADQAREWIIANAQEARVIIAAQMARTVPPPDQAERTPTVIAQPAPEVSQVSAARTAVESNPLLTINERALNYKLDRIIAGLGRLETNTNVLRRHVGEDLDLLAARKDAIADLAAKEIDVARARLMAARRQALVAQDRARRAELASRTLEGQLRRERNAEEAKLKEDEYTNYKFRYRQP